MKKTTSIFVISMIAMMVPGFAHADVAGVTYVENQLATKADKGDVYTKTEVDTKLDGKQAAGDYATTSELNTVKTTADTAVQPGDLAKVATSGSYNDLKDTPDIPKGALASKSSISNGDVAADAAIASSKVAFTDDQQQVFDSGITSSKVTIYDGYANQIANKVSANNPTVTITQGGEQIGSFTLNQADAATINLTDNDTKYTASGSNGVFASVSGTVVNVAGTAASKTAAGVVKVGDNINVDADGTISVADPVTVDAALSATSTNPVQNKVVNTALAAKAASADLTAETTARTSADTTLQANIDKKQDKLKTGEGGNITGGGNVSVSVDAESGKITISGTDADTVTTATTSGTGNVVSAVTATNGALTVTKGINAVTHTANTMAGDSTHPVYVASNGVATKIDKVAAAAQADSATTATNAKKICNGSACDAYVDIWVE